MRVSILGKFWRIIFTREGLRAQDAGSCDPPDAKGKLIRIDPKLRKQEKLEVILHEFLHAADWHKDEEWVRRVAEDGARMLWNLGYRCTEGE